MAIAGRVAIVPKGNWNNETVYKKLDAVSYAYNLYIAKKESINIEPTDTEYWMLALENISADLIENLRNDVDNITNGITKVGDADTLDGLHSDDFRHSKFKELPNGTSILDYVLNDDNVPSLSNLAFRIFNSSTSPISGSNDYVYDVYKLTNSFIRIIAYDMLTNNIYMISRKDTWGNWRNIFNANLIDGLPVTDLFRRYDLNQINIDNTPGCWSTDVSVNDGSKGTLPPDVAWCSVRQYVSQGEHFFAQIGQDFNHVKLFYRNRYLPTGTWSEWKFVGDGGNAKTLDGIGTSGFLRRYVHPTGTSANKAVQTGYHTCVGWTGIPSEAVINDTQGTIITINYNGLGGTIGTDNLWLKQQFISPHGMGTWTRYVYTTVVGEWVKDVTQTMVSSLAHTNFYTYTQNTNLNTLLAPGCYQLASSSHALSILNFPLGGVGGILRVEGNGNVRTQTFYAFAGKSNFVRVFYRHYFKNTETGEVYWSEWDEKISSQNVSNPNLLDNPDFRINQRGQSSYTASAQYTVDRWLHNTVEGFRVYPQADGGINLNAMLVPDDTAKATFIQYIENYKKLLGKTITISCKLKDDSKIYTKEVVIPTSAGSTKALNIHYYQNNLDVFLYHNGSNRLAFNIRINEADLYKTIIFEWVKLELGSCFTPFVPPNPAEELIKCQRYYERSDTICGLIFTGDKAFAGSQFKVEKRLIPTVKVTANLVGETANFNVKEVGYPTAKGFTYAVSERSFPTLSPIYYTYEADAEIY